jgi:threonine synthase
MTIPSHLDVSAGFGPDLLPPSNTEDRGMWRYRKLLPVGHEGPIMYPHPVGDTPLHAPAQLRKALGFQNLWLKDETRGPTCSNKDRATALVLEHGLHQGVRVVSCASTGNVAISLAVGAASVGLEAVVFVPADISEAKLAMLVFAGATVVKVGAGYQAAFELSLRAAREFGWLDRNTGVNPTTIEAKKTVAFEIWEQLDRHVPDTVVVPVGDGPTLCAMAKGFREIMACGQTTRTPRIIGVQSEGCQPLVDAWRKGRAPVTVEPNTIADGVAVGAPVLGEQALREVTESAGAFLSVSDEAILDTMRTLATTAGVIAEPAGALALAGFRSALRSGLIDRDEEVVVEVTGSGFKTPSRLRSDRPWIECEGRGLEEVREILNGAVARVPR